MPSIFNGWFMAVIYLSHPVHGAKVATMEAEAEYDEQNGWVRFDPTSAIVGNELVARHRGRAPAIKEVVTDDNDGTGSD